MHHNYINQLLLCNKYSYHLRNINIFSLRLLWVDWGHLNDWKLTYLCDWGVSWSWMGRIVWAVRPANLDWLSVIGTGQGSDGTDVWYLLFYYVIFSIQPLLVYDLLSLQLFNHSLHYSFKFYSIFKVKCQN